MPTVGGRRLKFPTNTKDMIGIYFTLASFAFFALQLHGFQFLQWRKAFDAEFDAIRWFPPYRHSCNMFENLIAHHQGK